MDSSLEAIISIGRLYGPRVIVIVCSFLFYNVL